MPSDPRTAARNCIAKATHPTTPAKEAAGAAMKACKLIAEHNLLEPAPSEDGILDKAASAAERVGNVAARPDVAETLNAAANLADKVGSLFGGQVRFRRGKSR